MVSPWNGKGNKLFYYTGWFEMSDSFGRCGFIGDCLSVVSQQIGRKTQ
jgi:hypothetical protein